MAVIGATAAELSSLVRGLSAAELEKTSGPGKWSVREILAHLADCEIAFSMRLRGALADEHHVVQPFDQDAWAKRYAGYRADEALAAFTGLRAWNVRLLGGVAESEYAKPVTHPERGQMTFRDLVETIAGHDENHLIQLRGILRG